MTIVPDGSAVIGSLGKRDLMPYRNAPLGTPIAGLAKKLYYQALTEIVGMDAGEEAFLDVRFGPPVGCS